MRHLVAEESHPARRVTAGILPDLPRDAPSGRERGIAALLRRKIENDLRLLVQPGTFAVAVQRLAYLLGEHTHLLAHAAPVRPLAQILRRAIVVDDLQRRSGSRAEK